jgi:hypothetical protein
MTLLLLLLLLQEFGCPAPQLLLPQFLSNKLLVLPH